MELASVPQSSTANTITILNTSTATTMTMRPRFAIGATTLTILMPARLTDITDLATLQAACLLAQVPGITTAGRATADGDGAAADTPGDMAVMAAVDIPMADVAETTPTAEETPLADAAVMDMATETVIAAGLLMAAAGTMVDIATQDAPLEAATVADMAAAAM